MTTKTRITAEPANRPGKARHNAGWTMEDRPHGGMGRIAVQTGHTIEADEQMSVADAAWPVWRMAGLTR